MSDFQQSVEWFKKLGWEQGWYWGDPPNFGAVWAGQCEIFLCQGAQGGHGRGSHAQTFGADGDQTGDKGVWMSVWVDDVDTVYRHCVAQGLDVTWPPTDHPWNVREMHVRHPDGHVFRISKSLEEKGSLSSTFDLFRNHLRRFIGKIKQRADSLTNSTHQIDQR